jgi:hypothetical protein
MTHDPEFAVAVGEGVAGALGWAWAAVKTKQLATYKHQFGVFLTRMAMTFNSLGLIGSILNRHFAQILEFLCWTCQKAILNLGMLFTFKLTFKFDRMEKDLNLVGVQTCCVLYQSCCVPL